MIFKEDKRLVGQGGREPRLVTLADAVFMMLNLFMLGAMVLGIKLALMVLCLVF